MQAAVRLEGPLDGWDAMAARHAAYVARGAEPTLVGVLFGPTGAGKSTLFRLLTGVPVPAGGFVRPLTHAPFAAVPRAVAEAGSLAELFPGYRLVELTDSADLRRLAMPDASVDALYYCRYDPPVEPGSVPLVLVDVPDFNASDETNWAKAERMLARAEVVVFTVYEEAYKDERVVRALARCCGLAGFLAYLLTKASPQAARPIREDLLKCLEDHPSASGVVRSDGRRARQFVDDCPFYHSPRAAPPTLNDIHPLDPDSPPFTSLLRGSDGEDILLKGLFEPTLRALRSSRSVLDEAGRVEARLDAELSRARLTLKESADRVAVSELPVGKIVQIVAEESVRLRTSGALHRWVGTSRTAFYRASSGLRSAWSRLASLFGGKRPPELKDRTELERQRLGQEAARLFDAWRLAFPADAVEGGLLSVSRHQPVRAAFDAAELPEPGREWESFVREEARAWALAHPIKSRSMAIGPDILAGLGLGILVLDLGVTGGLLTAKFMVANRVMNLDVIATTAGLGASAGVILKVLDSLGLTNLVNQAGVRWRAVREADIEGHLARHFFDPTFEPRLLQLEALRAAPRAEGLAACDRLESLATAPLRKEGVS